MRKTHIKEMQPKETQIKKIPIKETQIKKAFLKRMFCSPHSSGCKTLQYRHQASDSKPACYIP